MPRDTADVVHGPQPGKGLYEALMRRMPDSERDNFSAEQLLSLQRAAIKCQWNDHPVDFRLSIPLLFRRFYVVFVCGPERRGEKRRKDERGDHPIFTLGNAVFLTLLLGVAATSTYIASFIINMMFAGLASVFLPGAT